MLTQVPKKGGGEGGGEWVRGDGEKGRVSGRERGRGGEGKTRLNMSQSWGRINTCYLINTLVLEIGL